MKQQSVIAQKGEIEFRSKLFQQQVEGKSIFDDEFDTNAINEILLGRMKNTCEQMVQLKQFGVILSPYIEIGAERCQRSLVMENEIGSAGAAADISFDMLKSCEHYKNVFNKNKGPLRICCDANNLPFMSNSVPFIFCYETLHHFPDPAPVVKEVYRVLSGGGHFFFDEEPYKRILRVKLYKRKKIYSKESLRAGYIRKIFDYFFSASNCNEVEYGIIENEEISLSVWKQALSNFEEKKVKLHFLRHFDSELFNPKHYVSNFLASLFGGGISGICRKSGSNTNKITPINELLICPSCLENGLESKLYKKELSFFCSVCGNKFPIIENVVFLFSLKKLKDLYPGIYMQTS
jgi:ubiquinone/menaquinone biosynthesis C-methylase UbiE